MPNCPNNCISTEHCAQLSNTDKIICAIDKSTQKNIKNFHESHVNTTCTINSNSAKRDEKNVKNIGQKRRFELSCVQSAWSE